MAYIGNTPADGEFKKADAISSTFNGVLTQFNIDYGTIQQSIGDPSQLIVSLNGVIQEPLTAYTLGIGGGSIIFASAPVSGDTCHIVILGGVGGTITPSDNSVTASKLSPSLKDFLEQNFVANGSQTTYTLSRAATGANTLLLSIDGILQPSSAFSVSGTTLTIDPALPNTTNVRVVHLGVVAGVYVPAVDSVTADMIANSINTDIATGVAALPKAGGAMTGPITTNSTFDGVDVGVRDGILTSTTTTANAALPKAGGTMTGTIAGFTSTGIDDNATSTAVTIDASENVLVGKTSQNSSLSGCELLNNGTAQFTRDGNSGLRINRLTSNGELLRLSKAGTTVGSIGIQSYGFEIRGESGHAGISFATVAWVPMNDGTRVDNSIDLGVSSYRFDDIYATNGTIQTSDRNEKQDILAITTAESNVATACKGLLRSFRWKDAVAEKGDDARIHFGIIAQDLQDAFTAEGLDAGRYAMFISSTWWETQTEVPAVEAEDAVYEDVVTVPAIEAQDAVMSERDVTEIVETGSYVNLAGETIVETQEQTVTTDVVETVVQRQDIDGISTEVEVEVTKQVPVTELYESAPATEAVAEVTESRIATEAVEAKDAYTRTDTFDTLEEAPEGATERTRLGVRYPELLSFIIAAL